MDIESLREWFGQEKRDLPWRQTTDPYAILVSEIMLQQTQVSHVIPYYLRWIERFPTPHHLANASLDEVMKAWEGLGYYSRARNLHEAAKEIVHTYDGALPDHEEALKKIKGIGPYTVGALLNFAFRKKKEAVDGNVIRVITRYCGILDDISKNSTLQSIRERTLSFLPDDEPWVISEALIELGATVCQKKNPRCDRCPLQNGCASYRQQCIENIPYNSKKIKIETIFRAVAVVACNGSLLVKRGAKGKIMSDLYEFPFFEIEPGAFCLDWLEQKTKEKYGLTLGNKTPLKQENHSFTRFSVKLYPVLFSCSQCSKTKKLAEGAHWLTIDELHRLPFSSGHRRIFQQLHSHLPV